MKRKAKEAAFELQKLLGISNVRTVDPGTVGSIDDTYIEFGIQHYLLPVDFLQTNDLSLEQEQELDSIIRTIVNNGSANFLDAIVSSQGFVAPLEILARIQGTLNADDQSKYFETFPKGKTGDDGTLAFEWVKEYGSGLEVFDRNLLSSPLGGFAVKPGRWHKEQVQHLGVNDLFPGLLLPHLENTTTVYFPSKEAPSMQHIQILDPKIQYGGAASNMAILTSRHMPTVELSKCVPFLRVDIITPTQSTTIQGVDTARAKLNALDFHGADGWDVFDFTSNFHHGIDPALAASGSGVPAGMELFTAPQTMQHGFHNPTAFRTAAAGVYSVDNSRPFMTLTSFKEKITPSKGSMSANRASLNFVLHDRGRLAQIESLISPGLIHQAEIKVEYGWSHPDGTVTAENVYGKLLDSCRSGGIYGVYKSSLSFTAEGQVNISLEMVMKGTQSVNVLDSSMTGRLSPGWSAVEEAYATFKEARGAVGNGESGGFKNKYIADLAGTQHIATFSLSQTGNLLDKDFLKELKEFRSKVRERNMPALKELSDAMSNLQKAVVSADKALQQELDKKLKVIKNYEYHDFFATYQLTDYQGIRQGKNLFELSPTPCIGYETLARAGGRRKGITNLAAILQMFVVTPLAATGMYDEVQLVTYCANHNAAGAAGMNLGALPIDCRNVGKTSFEKILKEEYKKYGGQYPITRFMKFMSDNFIKPESSLCYALDVKTTKKYDAESGAIVFEGGKDVGASEKAMVSRLEEIYYSGMANSPVKPMQLTFRPINLKLKFEVGTLDPQDIIEKLEGVGAETPEELLKELQRTFTTLRIHVIDEAAVSKPGPVMALNGARQKSAGLILRAADRFINYPGMGEWLHDFYQCQADDLNGNSYLDLATAAGVLRETPLPSVPLTEENKKFYEEEIKKIDGYFAEPEKNEIDPDTKRDLQKNQEIYQKALDTGLEPAPGIYYELVSSVNRMIEFMSQFYPCLVYGEEGSTINSMQIKADTNSKGASAYMAKILKGVDSGEPSRGLPMRTSPVSLSLEMLGNPYVRFMQKYFLRADTGTSIDNLYAVTGVEHSLTPENYTTSVTLVPQEAYMQFAGLASDLSEIEGLVTALQNIDAQTAAG